MAGRLSLCAPTTLTGISVQDPALQVMAEEKIDFNILWKFTDTESPAMQWAPPPTNMHTTSDRLFFISTSCNCHCNSPIHLNRIYQLTVIYDNQHQKIRGLSEKQHLISILCWLQQSIKKFSRCLKMSNLESIINEQYKHEPEHRT